jgi:putative endonuclease
LGGTTGGDETRVLGCQGEILADQLLRRSGFRILARNWRVGRYEIDIVGIRREQVVFVEVKTRRPGPQPPSESLTPAQRRNILRAAAAWMRANPGIGSSFRFDLVAVTWPESGRPRVRYIAGAFDAHGP